FPLCSHLHSSPTRRSSDLLTGLGSRDCLASIKLVVAYCSKWKINCFYLCLNFCIFDCWWLSFCVRLSDPICGPAVCNMVHDVRKDRKSTRLNSSHVSISYA